MLVLLAALSAASYDDDDAVVVTAAIDGGSVPLRLRRAALNEDAWAAVLRHRLSRRAVGHCRQGNASCVTDLVVAEALGAPTNSSCRMRLLLPRPREVHVLGTISVFAAIEQWREAGWETLGPVTGPMFLDAWAVDGDAMSDGFSGWTRLDDAGSLSLSLRASQRRKGGGGSSTFPVRTELEVSIAARVDRCPDWLHAAVRVVYRPFAEPDPPRRAIRRSDVVRGAAGLSCAYATLLYDDDAGYAHGALALFQSLRDAEARHDLVAVLGDGVGKATRTALKTMAVRLFDATHLDTDFAGEAAALLPGLGTGQWLKLALWQLPFDRVLYLDADALVLTNIDDLVASAALGDAALAAVNDYFAGAVLLVVPSIDAADSFRRTLAQDAGRYVYGEQDFLNVHFAGTHALLAAEYHCLAEATAQTESFDQVLSSCAVLEFSSCERDATRRPWKPWHGRAALDPKRHVCIYPPNPAFHALAARWDVTYQRALATLTASHVAPPPPLTGRSADILAIRGTTLQRD